MDRARERRLDRAGRVTELALRLRRGEEHRQPRQAYFVPVDEPERGGGACRRIRHLQARRRAARDGRDRREQDGQVQVGAAGIVLAVGAGVAIGKAASYASLLHELRRSETAWLPLCLAGEVLAYAGYVVAYRESAAVDGGPRLSAGTTLRIVAAGFGAMILATGAGTLAVDYWALRRAGAASRDALARVIALNTLEWAVLAAAATGAAAALAVGVDGGAPRGVLAPWLAVVPLCFAAAFWVTAAGRYERLAAENGGRIQRLFAAAVRGVRLVRLLVSPRAASPGLGVVGAAAYWAGDLVCLWAGLRAFGVELGLAALVLAYATGYLVAALPLPAGGAGGVDAAMTYSLTLVGVPLAPALLGAFAYRLFNFWLPVLPALAVLPSVRRLGRRQHPALP